MDEKKYFQKINKKNIEFLLNRYNLVNRWVIADMIRRTAHHYPNKTALKFRDKQMTYSELEKTCNRAANALTDLGIKKYDRVAILAHNTIDHVLTWLGCCKLGAIYVPINYLLRGQDIQYCINHSESKIFIIEDALYNLVKDVLSEMHTVKALIWSNQGLGQKSPNGSFLEYESLYTKYPDTEPNTILRIEEPVQLTYTSGTESKPKGVIINNQALIAHYMGCIIDGCYESSDINVNALPIYHCAQRDCFLNPIFYIGATNVLIGSNVDEILNNVEKHKATMLFAPPTVWIGILRHPKFDSYNLSSLKKLYYGASIMPVEVLRELLERLPGTKIYNYYGQTELSPYHTILKAEDAWNKLGSAGKAGLNMETRLESLDGNPINEPGIVGEICGRGPHVMMMYYKDQEKTDEVMRGGWFHSGDLGVLDEDGYITVVDRKKDVVKTGGENVSSREVEEVIYLDKRVEEVAVIGVPHPKWIEAVTAVIVPKKGENITADEIINLCRSKLAPFKVPKNVIFVDSLPKTPTGKLLKREMRKIYKDISISNNKNSDST